MNQKKRPNILMIMTDDQGAWALGCAGNSEIISPNIDRRIAQKGMLFDNFFCASPVCSPARASIYTGMIPSRHGIHDWLAKGHLDEEVLSDELRDAFRMDNPAWEYQWPKNQLKDDRAVRYLDGRDTFVKHLAESGYVCGLSGKWHLGDSFRPQQGFSFWRTTAMGGENYYYPVVLENGKMELKRNVYITDWITDMALEFLDSHTSDAPFFLSVNYTAPHAPWQREHHPAAFYDLYADCKFESTPNVAAHEWSDMRWMNEQQYADARKMYLRGYFTAITAMDAGVGRILDTLEMRGLREDTLVIFTGDNGMSMGHHGIFGKGNGTFPMNMYDTAVKVPCIFSHPEHIPANVRSNAMLSHYDLYETLLDYTDTPHPHDKQLPGCSFTDVLSGVEKEAREVVVICDEYGPVRMIRTREYKYIHRYPYGPHEFYDLRKDPGELKNSVEAPEYQDIICSLRATLTEWFARYADPAVDGKSEAVRGAGQISPVNLYNPSGRASFRK